MVLYVQLLFLVLPRWCPQIPLAQVSLPQGRGGKGGEGGEGREGRGKEYFPLIARYEFPCVQLKVKISTASRAQ